mgnify:CR=1 FL=1
MTFTSDTEWGAFDQNPPWVLQHDNIKWQKPAVALRAEAQREVPVLTKPSKIPPVVRLITVVFVLSKALIPWFVKKKRNKTFNLSLYVFKEFLGMKFTTILNRINYI